MNYTIPKDFNTLLIISAVALIMLAFNYFYLKRKKVKIASYSIIGITISLILYELLNGTVKIDQQKMIFSSGFYTKSININDIEAIDYNPPGFSLNWRTNGLSLFNIKHGYFIDNNGNSIFSIINKAPFLVIITAKDVVAISYDEKIESAIKQALKH